MAPGFLDVAHVEDQRWILAQAIISLGKAVGLTVIAERVERRDQVQRLKAAGCELAQGFFFARPLHAETLAAEFARDAAQPLGSDRLARAFASESEAA
ncbi:MAG: EAL domain-containing protein [Candidatus Limnocylindria bacterium]